MANSLSLAAYQRALPQAARPLVHGRVVQVTGLLIEAEGLRARVGELVYLTMTHQTDPLAAEVVGFRSGRTLLMPLGEMDGLEPGGTVRGTGAALQVGVGDALLGRVIDALGIPIDGLGPLGTRGTISTGQSSPSPLSRRPIDRPLATGIRVMDSLLTCGEGQRIGIFAGSGVGKSTFLGMIARGATSDISVIALIGERGREVREFLERDLGPEALKRTVVVVSTSDQPALLRLKGAWIATAIAEYFRAQGHSVTFLMDSVTRFAMAQREVGLAVGEPPTTKGYTPSVFALLPKLLERTGTDHVGAITAFYTVLVEGDDMNDPVADTVRGILDGHVVLTRSLAAENHYPAVDVLQSISRVMPAVISPEHRQQAGRVRELLATFRDAQDLIAIGAYQPGSSPMIDRAIAARPALLSFLRQRSDEMTHMDDTLRQLAALAADPDSGSLR